MCIDVADVLHRHAGLAMFGYDVYASVVGGVRVSEPSTDLAVLMAVLSSFRDRPLPEGQVVFGEVGLSGEVRPVAGGQERLHEAAKHGFTQAIIPKANLPRKGETIEGLNMIAVQRVSELIETAITF